MSESQPNKLSRLHLHLLREGLSQVQLAELSGVPREWINRYINGSAQPGPERRRRIAAALGVEESELFEPLSETAATRAAIGRLGEWLDSPEGQLVAGRVVRVLAGC